MPPTPVLTRIRDRIVADPESWIAVKDALAQDGMAFMDADMLKRAPKGYDPDHPLIDDLRRKSYAVGCSVSDDEVCAPDFLGVLTQRLHHSAPLLGFLCEALELPF